MSLFTRSLMVMSFLWGLVFAVAMAIVFIISMALGPSLDPSLQGMIIIFPVIIAFVIVFIQYLVSPWIMDFMLRWVYDLEKYPVDALPSHIRDFLMEQMEKKNFSLKYVAIIFDNNPNAFVFGHTKKRARMVITRGILELLTPEEQIAVVAHEVGHIVHRDFIWMTVASAIPLICYSFYQGLWTFARITSASKDDDAGKVGVLAFVIAVIAWFVYYISHFVVLFLSRVREYYADDFSADVTQNGGYLSRALVKIAYGMVKSDSERQAIMGDKNYSKEERKRASRQYAFSQGSRSLGIFDNHSAQDLAKASYGRGSGLDADAVAAAAAWDLSNPWGGFLELQSTHPLPAKRILALNKKQVTQGHEPEFPDVGKVKPPESLWDEFLVDLFLMYLAPIMFFLLPILGIVIVSLAGFDPNIGIGAGLILFAGIWKLRRREKYPKLRMRDETLKIAECLTDMTPNGFYEASPLRGKPAVFEGTVIGRGTPGYWLSEDLVIQDDTGILTLDYSPILGFMSWIFALFRAPRLMEQRIKVYGWYHRGPGPVLQVWKILTPQGTHKNRWSGANWFFNWLCLLVGFGLLVYGFSLSF